MQPLHADKNQYLGINAHLHSYWQAVGGWDSFHTLHIVFLIREVLLRLPRLNYEADIEPSIQRRHSGDPNVTYKAVAIYEIVPQTGERGELITWIELLSPSNKPTGSDFGTYADKRKNILKGGVVFVEIDYLHEYPPTLNAVPNYRPCRKSLPEPISSPYRIAVIDPHPEFLEGEGHIYQFAVDQSIPKLPIPLRAEDKLDFDFNTPYRRPFEEMLYGSRVDYTQLPLNFDLYSPQDQAMIACRMLTVLKAAAAGLDLENGPFPIAEILPLDESLPQIHTLTAL